MDENPLIRNTVFRDARAAQPDSGIPGFMITAEQIQIVDGTLKLMSETELLMADFYRVCSKLWSDNAAFWEEIAQDEVRHSQIILKMLELITARPGQYTLYYDFKPAGIEGFSGYVRKMRDRAVAGEISQLNLLALLKDMERCMIEEKFFIIVTTSNPEYRRLVDGILEDTSVHKDKIGLRLLELSQA